MKLSGLLNLILWELCMPLNELVSVNGRFLRSVRIDKDDRTEALGGFVFSSSVRELLSNFAHQQSEA